MTQNYFTIRRKQTSKISQSLSCKYKIYESNTRYPQIMELSACILNMFFFVFLCAINLLISLGMASLFFTYKAIQCVPPSAYSSRIITYATFFIVLGKLSLE